MNDYGFWSLIPPLAAIVLAIRTKQVYLSLMAGIWMGWLVIYDWNFFTGSLATIQGLVDVFKDAGNTRTIMFSALIGSLILFIQQSGGVKGFILWLEKKLQRYDGKKGNIIVQLLAWITGVLIFVESNISVLTVGALYRPVFDKLKISREKLAYIGDSSSAPTCILIPFNAWGAFIIGLLITQGFEQPFGTLLSSIKYNFYPILALLAVPVIILLNRDFGPMKKAEKRTRNGEILWPGAKPMMSEELTSIDFPPHVHPKAFNMVVPVATMVLTMPLMLYYTGIQSLQEKGIAGATLGTVISNGSGSVSVLVSVITALILCFILFRVQKIFRIRQMAELTLKGISEMMPLALLMLMAFAISNVSKELNTGVYVAELTRSWLSPGIVPFILFLVSAFIAFSTGTSWGTFGIMIAIAIPMARSLGADEIIVIAAVLGGGIFGDHCSPISDTTIISSMAAATDHIDHVKTQLPYALIIGLLTSVGYLLI
ncbi:MAG TPA: Na+/H+ antiporter NhaC family protein [Saprospiraceae bacterium]|nr:Na+/H+ antiporter NhaC family protein [Saprospiraceae bacterium]